MNSYSFSIASTGADICDLEVSCPAFSYCDTKYIWPGWSPASYYCVCDIGYVPSVVRPGNYILPNENCLKQTVGKFVSRKAKYCKEHMDCLALLTRDHLSSFSV